MAATEPAAGDTYARVPADAAGGSEADADSLFVLTACLLTPARFPSVLGDDYPAACAALGLEPYEEGYGLVLGQDGLGARWTVVVDDVSLVAVAIASWDCGMAYDLSPGEESVVAALPGWPLAVATRAPGVPEPHDPEPEEGDPAPLVPPAEDVWGPAQRRLGADEVALRWHDWRAQIEEAPPAPASGADTPVESAPAPDGPYAEVRRALEELRGYLEEAPPAGRVRSAPTGGEARALRADGPGWSLVARTDDMAFVLLDAHPREVLPVTRGPRLPGLLEALDAIAVRHA
ncbi:hypothetical protein GCM10010305_37870 [Streptomyces termitum]|uniref:Integral membrane protein n=1 Tax=Streptomyces termitum TaxID=67368 RepID=A0A918T5I3_9ACTN|nr:hypothetical protein GCM10010305_37870 [Streptomyces termitum]